MYALWSVGCAPGVAGAKTSELDVEKEEYVDKALELEEAEEKIHAAKSALQRVAGSISKAGCCS